jgi:hypothetical protein
MLLECADDPLAWAAVGFALPLVLGVATVRPEAGLGTAVAFIAPRVRAQ